MLKGMPQLPLALPPEEGFGARDFVVSAPNLDAFTRLQSWPGPDGGATALIGPAGVGKSHLAALWSVRTGARTVDAREPFDALDLDDRPLLVEHADGGFADATLFHLINLGRRRGCALLITARTPPAAWATALPDLRSRLNALPVLTLEAPDDAVLEGMLQRFFRRRRILPSQELLAYLVRRIDRSAEAAEEAVARLDAEAAAKGKPVGRKLARKLFGEDGTADLFE
ncbi:DnaA regulatory inactivator HdaA [soil metagenome]